MAVDLQALDRAAAGDPAAKVAVSMRWLQEVHKLLIEGEKAKAALERSRTMHELCDRTDAILSKVMGRY